jgi:hydrogenase nickel incorporation protein HypB
MNTNIEKVRQDSLSLNPHLKIFEVSCTTGVGIAAWTDWLSGLKA